MVEKLSEDAAFEKIEAVNPGFINIIVSGELLAANAEQMDKEERFGVEIPEKPKTIVIDYGGPNVAKPLHVGHLRSAVIGESVKRICRFMGNKVIGDVHLGDWGLQIGLIITELKKRQPDLLILTSPLQENIRKKHHLPFRIWRKSIRMPAVIPKSMRII